jgi:hypothetical protein
MKKNYLNESIIQPFLTLCGSGNLDSIQSFYLSHPYIASNNHFLINSFRHSVISNQLHIAEWFINKHPNIDFHLDLDELFKRVCIQNKMDIVQWLLQLNVSFKSNHKIFHHACINNNMILANWIHDLNPEAIINNSNYEIFENACLTNKIDVAKWIYKINPTLIQKTNHYKIFCSACYKNNLQLAKWIYQINSSLDVTVNDHELFKYTCHNDLIEIARFIQQIQPYYYIILSQYTSQEDKYFYNDYKNSVKIKYHWKFHIRSEKEARFQERLLPLWLSSNNSPNKNCLLYQLPRDISRYIVEKFI